MKKKALLKYSKELQNEAFWKGLRVIQSCKNVYHLDGAKNFINHYIKVFGVTKNGTITATGNIAHQFDMLRFALKEKKEKLN